MQDEPAQNPSQTMVLGRVPDEDDWSEQGRRLRFLRRVDLLRGLPRELLIALATALKPHSVTTGAIVCREGEQEDDFYLIEAGTLAVTVEIAGEPHELARLGPGQFFGEMALLRGGRRTATVRAETPARLWSLAGAEFRQFLDRIPDLDAAVRRTARARESAAALSVFEVENRNLAALAQNRPQILIGRGPDNDLNFASRLVSRHHAVLERVGDGFRLRDLGSANGTFVDGVRIHTADLYDGAEIRLADERFVFDRREIRRCLEPHGLRVDIADVSKEVKGGKKLLREISLSILPGELVAIVGGSGAGKTTLMDAISGVRPATSGRVLYNGTPYYSNRDLYRHSLGYVPQDDIIHRDLSVRRTLQFAAKLRLPPDTSPKELDSAVDDAMRQLSLTGQADLQVARLSGGQRKRASIGVELLTQPRIFFLDEPTSGLDPATDAQMMRLLRRLADEGSTVVLTTHATKNVALCDKIVFLARGGHLAFVGSPRRALQYFETEAFDEIYDRLEDEATPEEWARRFRASEDYARALADQAQPSAAAGVTSAGGRASGGILSALRQFLILSQRNLEILRKNPPNFVPLAVQPIVITLLLLALDRAGAFKLTVSNPLEPGVICFFLGFVSLFFAAAYGIKEIAKEFPIFYRERLVNLNVVPYVFSKVVVGLPILILTEIVMIILLRVTTRLPASGFSVYGPMLLTLILTAFGGLALGLFASSALKSVEQGPLLLPLLILPQVIFSGAILPVPSMPPAGKFISNLMLVRWSFEALGHNVGLNDLFAHADSPLAKPLLAQFGNSFARATAQSWGILGIFVVVFLTLCCLILKRKSATT